MSDPAGKRFYERDPKVAKLVQLLDSFPKAVQAIVLEGLIQFAEQNMKAKELLHELRSLGSEKVLALFQSKKKRRHYDADPVFHQAMNYLLIFSDENRRFLAEQMIEMMGYFLDYLKVSDGSKEAERSRLIQMKETFISRGGGACQVLIAESREYNNPRSQNIETQEGLPDRSKKDNVIEEDPNPDTVTPIVAQSSTHEVPDIASSGTAAIQDDTLEGQTPLTGSDPNQSSQTPVTPSAHKLKEDSQGMRITRKATDLV